MEREREEESGEMYSPNESGEYTPHGDALTFTVQGLWDALTKAESAVTEPSPQQMNSLFSWKRLWQIDLGGCDHQLTCGMEA